ncbi:MAG TPA: helix-turn-helix domain-containing protein, partial [Trueperaceae bacterium]
MRVIFVVVTAVAPKVDARVRRTRSRLQGALVALVLEGDYDQVTIRDVADRADVGYATFFRHYRDKEELLVALLEDLLDELLTLLAP